MRNVEIKARCPDLQPVHAILMHRELERVARMRQVDTYFTTQKGRLKLREIDGTTFQLIGYRRPDTRAARLSTYSIAKIGDPAALRSVLAGVLGVRVVVSKIRDLYVWGNTRVHLDAVDALGTFVELETEVYGDEIAAAERECGEVFAELGLREPDVVAASYADLIDAGGLQG